MENNKFLINRIQTITYIAIIIIFGLFTILDAKNYIELKPVFGLIVFGIILLCAGIFGFLKNEIALRNVKPISYKRESIFGRIINLVICLIGAIFLIIGAVYSIIG